MGRIVEEAFEGKSGGGRLEVLGTQQGEGPFRDSGGRMFVCGMSGQRMSVAGRLAAGECERDMVQLCATWNGWQQNCPKHGWRSRPLNQRSCRGSSFASFCVALPRHGSFLSLPRQTNSCAHESRADERDRTASNVYSWLPGKCVTRHTAQYFVLQAASSVNA